MTYTSQAFTGYLAQPFGYDGTNRTFTTESIASMYPDSTTVTTISEGGSSIEFGDNVKVFDHYSTRSQTVYLGYYLNGGNEYPLVHQIGNFYYLLGITDTTPGVTYAITPSPYTQGTFSSDPFVACYLRGTRILTCRGEVAIEELQIGDLVATFAGRGASLKPVRWLGHRRIDLRRHPDPENTHPIRFHRGSLGEGCPHRDLVVSPGHRMRVDAGLVTALELVNGASIVQESPAEAEYWHVELDGHDLLLAEGVQAETYLDIGNRNAFQNGAVVAHNPVLDGDVPEPCLPYAGASVGLRERLIARAQALGWTRNIDADPWLEVDGSRIEPVWHGLRCRFELPAGSSAVSLRSRTGRPLDVCAQSGDRRQLGLKLHFLGLETRDGLREVPLTSLVLEDGLHPVELDAEGRVCRWTTGTMALNVAELAAGEDVRTLEIGYDQALPMWVRPAAVRTDEAADMPSVGREDQRHAGRMRR